PGRDDHALAREPRLLDHVEPDRHGARRRNGAGVRGEEPDRIPARRTAGGRGCDRGVRAHRGNRPDARPGQARHGAKRSLRRSPCRSLWPDRRCLLGEARMSAALAAYIALVTALGGTLLAFAFPSLQGVGWMQVGAWILVSLLAESLWLSTISGKAMESMASTVDISLLILLGFKPSIWIVA